MTEVELNEECESEKMSYSGIMFPPEFVYLNKAIPEIRVSGEEEFSVKSSSLPKTEPIEIITTVGKPF